MSAPAPKPAPAYCRSVANVEVFADITCPFTHVGLTEFVRARRAAGRDHPLLIVRSWPLELVNDHPATPASVAGKVNALRASVAPDLFVGFDPDQFPTTSIPALALAGAAYANNTRTGEAVSLALRHALFEEGRDIADPDVLAALAAGFGVQAPAPGDDRGVRADWAEGQRRGVRGSPHFFVGDRAWFCPTLHIDEADGQLRVGRDPQAEAEFLRVAFA